MYAKASNIEKLISPIKSKIGQIISDNATNSFIIIDNPENIELIKKVIANFDVKLETKVFALNYAKPKDIAERLKNIVSLGISDIQTDEKSNLVIVTDFKEKIDEISKLISDFDRKHREVLIDVKIVSIILNDEFQMGVNWQSVFTQINNTPMAGTVPGNFATVPAAGSGLNLNVGTLQVNNFNAVYSMLQTAGKTNTISSPRIATLENEEAKILVGNKRSICYHYGSVEWSRCKLNCRISNICRCWNKAACHTYDRRR